MFLTFMYKNFLSLNHRKCMIIASLVFHFRSVIVAFVHAYSYS
jgi:hypothetical protein